MSRRVAIAATGPASLAAGPRVAREGGNAVDVAIAAALTTMSTEPGIVSLGGGAFISIWAPDAEPILIDGNVEMPGRGLRPGAARGRRHRDPHGIRRRGDPVCRPRLGRGPRGAARLPARRRGARRGDVGRGRRARRPGVPRRLPRRQGDRPLPRLHRRLASSRSRPEAQPLVTRDDGTPLRAGDTGRNPELGRRARPHRPRGGSSVADDRRHRPGARRRHGRARRPHHPPRPRRVRPGHPDPHPASGRAVGPRVQPAAVGRRADARGDDGRARPAGLLALAGRHRDPAGGPRLPA